MDVTILILVGVSVFLALFVMVQVVGLIIISKKTHGIIEFKSMTSGTPIGAFFQDNKYVEWRNTKPDAGMIEDKDFGSFVIDTTYIDKFTNNIIIPFNPAFAVSLNTKAVKMADDLTYMFKEQQDRKRLKAGIMQGLIPETEGISTLRTTVNFSTIKHFLPPMLPHSIQSKIIQTVKLRLKQTGINNMPNILLLVVSALGALILGGLVLRYVVFGGGE